MAEQKKKLVQSLAFVVATVDRPEVLRPVLHELGAKHVGYGVRPEHYGPVGQTLLAALAQTAGEAWNGDLSLAWSEAYAAVAAMMQEGAARAAKPAPAKAGGCPFHGGARKESTPAGSFLGIRETDIIALESEG
jgi:hemoglobin-like flavoprotein